MRALSFTLILVLIADGIAPIFRANILALFHQGVCRRLLVIVGCLRNAWRIVRNGVAQRFLTYCVPANHERGIYSQCGTILTGYRCCR